MPSEESKPVDPAVGEADAKLKGKQTEVGSEPDEGQDDDDDDDEQNGGATATADGSGSKKQKKKKKKKSKREKAKELLTRKSGDQESEIKKAIGGLTPQQMKELLALNPSLAQEVSQASGSADPTPEQTAAMFKKMDLQDIMTGLASAGKNVKDMGAYKFWQTQPVPRFGEEDKAIEEGPLEVQTVDKVDKEPHPLVDGFEWVKVDLCSEEEMKEVYELLNGHYVEDDEAMFRFNYSPSILRW